MAALIPGIAVAGTVTRSIDGTDTTFNVVIFVQSRLFERETIFGTVVLPARETLIGTIRADFGDAIDTGNLSSLNRARFAIEGNPYRVLRYALGERGDVVVEFTRE